MWGGGSLGWKTFAKRSLGSYLDVIGVWFRVRGNPPKQLRVPLNLPAVLLLVLLYC